MTIVCCDKSQLPSSNPEAARRMKRPNGPISLPNNRWTRITIDHPSCLLITGGTAAHRVYAVPDKPEEENILATEMVYNSIPFTTPFAERRSLLYLQAPGPWSIISDNQDVSAAVLDSFDGILPLLLQNKPIAARDLSSGGIAREIDAEDASAINTVALSSFFGLATLGLNLGRDETVTDVLRPIQARDALEEGAWHHEKYGLFVNAREASAQRQLTATAAAGIGVTLTLPAPGLHANAHHHICYICITKYASAAKAGAAATDVVTTTNLGGIAWDTKTVLPIGEIERIIVEPTRPIRSVTPASASTIVCPALGSVIWRVTAAWWEG